jgi:hypothetical protein
MIMRLTRPAVFTGALLAVALPALAAIGPYKRGTIGVRETVCAQDLYVRTAPEGAWMGTLYYGQTFHVESRSGDYVYGFAYGNINRKGWVQDGWFCY